MLNSAYVIVRYLGNVLDSTLRKSEDPLFLSQDSEDDNSRFTTDVSGHHAQWRHGGRRVNTRQDLHLRSTSGCHASQKILSTQVISTLSQIPAQL